MTFSRYWKKLKASLCRIFRVRQVTMFKYPACHLWRTSFQIKSSKNCYQRKSSNAYQITTWKTFLRPRICTRRSWPRRSSVSIFRSDSFGTVNTIAQLRWKKLKHAMRQQSYRMLIFQGLWYFPCFKNARDALRVRIVEFHFVTSTSYPQEFK